MNKSPQPPISAESFHRKYRNLFVGLFILIPVIMLPGFLVYTFLKTDMLEKWEYINVRYANANGLTRNTAVTILGMKVGYVDEVNLNNAGYIDVKMKIKRAHMDLIRKDSKAKLQQKNVAFGDWEVEITDGTPAAGMAADGDTLESVVLAPIAKTLDQVTKTVETLQSILQSVRDGKGTVGKLFMDDSLIRSAQGTVKNVNGLVLRAHTTIARVDTVLIKVAQIGDKGKIIADSVIGIAHKVGVLVTDVNLLVNSVQTTSKDLPAIMARVQGDISEVELLLKALQSNSIVKSGINSQADPMIGDVPEK
jgi:phospholipid/cholesterol/gamma-HCH transport system substrate-binding protein